MTGALRAGEGRSRSHPAADVAGEDGASGEGDRADSLRIRQQVSWVSMREFENSEMVH